MKRKRGNCYVTCEALYHLLGGKNAGLTPMIVKHEGETHWYLQMVIEDREYNCTIVILDPTAKQFKKLPNYHKGKGCGFLTKEPSKRARILMEKLLWQE